MPKKTNGEIGNYGIVDIDGNVINIIYWDGEPPWVPDEGTIAVRFEDGDPCSIGGTYKDGKFYPAPPPENRWRPTSD